MRPAASASSSVVSAFWAAIQGLSVPDDVLNIAEIDANERIVAAVTFDLDDIDAAFEELDARYLAGEAAAHARTWSVIAGAYAALNRHELPATTPEWVNIDHRRVATIAAGDADRIHPCRVGPRPDSSIHIEAVHRLSNLGAVFHLGGAWDLARGLGSRVAGINILTVEGDLISRCEIFDEAEIDAALARFDELSRPAPRLENAASQVDRALLRVHRGPRLGRHGGS